MFEKVNPSHPDKICDRIAGAIVDLAYRDEKNPRIAVEVMLGHGYCHVIIETNVILDGQEIDDAIYRIAGYLVTDVQIVGQDKHLAKNQKRKIRAADNGVFKGVPLSDEQIKLADIARKIYTNYPYDGKYILDKDKLIICQSNAKSVDLEKEYPGAIINPLGFWTGGPDVDTGATNRKLGSDMADSITGGGLHGKDVSKADVSVNIYTFLKAQETGRIVEFSCAIGDEYIDGKPYSEIVKIAKDFIDSLGGFEKFAEWGLF